MTDIQRTFYNLNIRAVYKGSYKRRSNTEEERQMLRVRFWRHAREIKIRIFRYI